MISNELKIIVARLQEQGNTSFIDGIDDESIALFEENNKVILPQKYKEWLNFSDGGECFLPAGVQFYGVAHKPMIDVDDTDRPDESYCVIGALSTGDPLLCKKGEESISIYNHEAGRIEKDEVYPDFFSFLNDLHEILGIGG